VKAGLIFIGFCLGMAVYDPKAAVMVFISVGVILFVLDVVFDFFSWLFGPRQQVHIHVEKHPDPTRPDWIYEDASPLVFIENGKNGRQK